jgi:hypothetical protein
VQKFHPAAKVNIVAHSMGGILARRYILDNPQSHSVSRLITVGTPWLGAPKAIYTLETGKFFSNPFTPLTQQPAESTLDFALSNTLKALIEFFPGSHELLPSEWYFNLGGRPFADVAGQTSQIYNLAELTTWLNQQHPRSNPGSASVSFHGISGQDDWRGDQTGVDYYHIYGEQKRNITVGRVLQRSKTYCVPLTDICTTRVTFDVDRTNGDGTVPLLSSRRFENGINLNAGVNSPQDLRYFIVQPPTSDQDSLADHGGMTHNTEVQNLIVAILKGIRQQQPGPPPVIDMWKPKVRRNAVRIVNAGFSGPGNGTQQKFTGKKPVASILRKVSLPTQTSSRVVKPDFNQTMQHDLSYYITLVGIGNVTVTDAFGNSNEPISDVFVKGLPGVVIDPIGTDSVQVVTGTDKEYTITFRSNGTPIGFDIIKGTTNTEPEHAIRYVDLSLPTGVVAALKISPYGVEDLRYDADGDGVFESSVSPTVSLAGPAAQDLEAPIVSFSEKFDPGKRLVTINAVDSGSGLKAIRYSFDAKRFQVFTNPLSIDPSRVQAVYVLADDNAANRSSIVTYKPLIPEIVLKRDQGTREIVVTAKTRNTGTGAVTVNFALNTATLNGKPTTTPMPFSITVLAPGEEVTMSLRFPPHAASAGTRAVLYGSGSSHGVQISGGVSVTVP